MAEEAVAVEAVAGLLTMAQAEQKATLVTAQTRRSACEKSPAGCQQR